MKNTCLFTLLVLVLFFTGCTQTELKEFKCEEGNFSVMMPGTPSKEIKDVPTAVGKVQLIMYMAGTGNEVYMASYSDYPEEFAKAADVDSVLQGAKTGAVQNVKGELISEENIKLQDIQGLLFNITVPEKAHMRCKIFLKANRMFQFMIISPVSGSYSEAQLKFLESPKFLK